MQDNRLPDCERKVIFDPDEAPNGGITHQIPNDMNGFKEVPLLELTDNFFLSIGKDWMLITAGDRNRCNTMTASWGGIGELWGSHVAFIFIRPQRYTKLFIDAQPCFTLSFPGAEYRQALNYCGSHSGQNEDKITRAGLTVCYTEDGTPAIAQAHLILACRKLYSDMLRSDRFTDRTILERWYPEGDLHEMYVAQIEHAWIKE